MSDAELVVDCRNSLGEMPLWDAQARRVSWIDVIRPGRLFRLNAARGCVDFEQIDDNLTSLAACTDPSALLVARTRDISLIGIATHDTRCHLFSLPEDQTDQRFNDGRCDDRGRFWIGSMPNNLAPPYEGLPLPLVGSIYCVEAGQEARRFDAELGCPNAICWSPNYKTFYVADSVTGWIYAYDYDSDLGHIRNKREFFRDDDLGIPDGAAIDVDGCIWNARWGAGVVARITPEGALDRVLPVPAIQPTACCFGGDTLDTLYVTSARHGLSPEELAAQPYSGGLFAALPRVSGAPVPAFAGRVP